MLWALLACQDWTIRRTTPSEPPPVLISQVERFVQEPAPAVDLLFVVDSTASMEQELDRLADAAPDFLQTLDEAGLDWQIGVASAAVRGSYSGWLLGDPYVLTPDHPSPVEAFVERFPSPDDGGETGFSAAALALELAQPGEVNAGFRRSGARLTVVFVSDADDSSLMFGSSRDPLDVLLEQVRAQAPGGAVAAIVGDLPSGCSSFGGVAQPGERYHAAAEASGGVTASICSDEYVEVLEDLAIDSPALPLSFELRSEPDRDAVEVRLDGERTVDFVLEGSVVVFDTPPPAGTVVEVRYFISEEA